MRVFYGWKMVAAGGGLQFLQSVLLHQGFGAYVAMLSAERGWSKTALAGGAALQSMEAALLGPALGWIIDRFGPQWMIRLGIVVFGCGFMALSQVETLPGFYLAVAVIAVGSSLSGFFPLNVAIIHWFERKRARALSVLGLGLAVGGMFVPLVAGAMQLWGWRVTAFSSGIVVIVLGLPLAMTIRRRPQDHGETVDGLPAETVSPAAAAEADEGEFSAAQALRTPAFWLLAVGHAFALLVVTAVNVHAIAHMKEGLGYTVAQAALVITVMTVAQVGGVFVGWAIGDRCEKRYLAALAMLMHATGLLCLAHAAGVAGLIAFAVLHGSAWGLRGPFMQAMRADYFGRNAIGMILGLSAIVAAAGQVGGPMIAGAFADAHGHYRTGFDVLAGLAALGSVLFLVARRPRLSI